MLRPVDCGPPVPRREEEPLSSKGALTEEGISLDGNPPVPTKPEEERALRGERVKESEVKSLGDWNVPVPRRDEELASS